MKTDRLLLVAIVAVMAAVVGYLFFSDDSRTSAGGDAAGAVDANAARSSLGASEREKQLQSSRKDCEEFTLPAEFRGRSAEDVAGFFGERDAYRISTANAQADDYGAGKTIFVPHAWVTAHEARVADKVAKSAATKPALPVVPDAPVAKVSGEKTGTGTAAKPPAKTPEKESGVAKSEPPAKRANPDAPTESSRPWAKFLMTSKAGTSSGSPAPVNATREERRATSVPAGSIAAQPTAGSAYKAKQGETLWKIAEIAYGKGSRWKEIAAANESMVGADGARLRAGMVISIP